MKMALFICTIGIPGRSSGRKRQERARKRAESEGEEDLQIENSPKDNPKDNPIDSPPDSPTDKTKKPKKAVKKKTEKKVEKKQYAKFVSLEEEEYQKLVHGYGPEAADKFIEELNLYKGSTGRTYKSDYMTILNWVTDKVDKKYPGLIRRPAPAAAQKSEQEEVSGNPFGQWKE